MTLDIKIFVNNLKEELKQPINFIASIVTLLNFLYSLSLSPGDTSSLPDFPIQGLPFRIMFFLLFEGALASVFGFYMAKLAIKGQGIPIIIVIFLSLLSGWLSIFNVQWIIILNIPKNFIYHLLILIFSAGAFILAAYMIYVHWGLIIKENELDSDNDIDEDFGEYIIIIQLICFVLIYFITIILPYWKNIFSPTLLDTIKIYFNRLMASEYGILSLTVGIIVVIFTVARILVEIYFEK